MATTMSSSGERRARPVLGLLAWVVLLLTVAFGGQALARGALAPPSLGDPGSWAGWASGRTPLEAVFAVLGLVVVVLAWYLLAATVLVVAVRRRGLGRLVTLAEVLTLPLVRRTVNAVLGVGLVGTSVAGGTAGAVPSLAHQGWREPLVELVVATVPDDTSTVDDEDAPVMRLLPDESQGEAPSTPGRPQLAPPPASPQVLAGEREVRPGDHLWSLAGQILHDAGAAADDDEVVGYWRQLIEANVDRLADPANPDLIFPGQVLVVPTPPPPAPPVPAPAPAR